MSFARFATRLLLRSNAPLRVSLREHFRRVRQRGFALIVSGVGGVLGLIALTVPASTEHQFVPEWLWISLLVGGLMLAQFLAFHDVRKERDEAKADIDRRFDLLRYRFEMVGLEVRLATFFPEHGDPEYGYASNFQFFNGGLEPLEWEVEWAAIEIGGATSIAAERESSGGILLPGQMRMYRYGWIPSPDQFVPGFRPPGGRGEYSVVYGHPSGGQRFRTQHRFLIAWQQAPGSDAFPYWTTQGKITHEPA